MKVAYEKPLNHHRITKKFFEGKYNFFHEKGGTTLGIAVTKAQIERNSASDDYICL